MDRLSADLLIRASAVIPIEPPGAVIRDGYVAVEGGRIASVGRAASMPPVSAEEVIDARGEVALPGLVNAHAHVAMTLLRGVAADSPLADWLAEVWRLEATMGPDEVYAGARLGILEMLLTGTTTFADMYFYEDSVAKAALESGIRVVLSYGMIDSPGWEKDPSRTERELREAERLADKWHGAGDGRVRVAIGPHSPYTCSRELLGASASLARSRGLRIHIHLSETRAEVEEVEGRTGLRPPSYLDSLGVLGPDLLAAHGVWLDPDDIRLLSSRGVSVVHCPSSNLKLGSGVAPVADMLRESVNVALGTDGPASNDSLDMFREMRLAALLQRGTRLDPRSLTSWEALRMATLGGARALGLAGEVGTLEPGKRADIILVNLRGPHAITYRDPPSALVFSATGRDVSTVIVDGRVVVRGGRAQTLNEGSVKEEALRASERVLAGG